jgi:hypothetical protein
VERGVRRAALALAFAALALGPAAHAAEKGKEKDKEIFLNLQPIGLPVISKGALVNYVFVNLKLVLGPGREPAQMHDKEPYLRDQLVRLASRTPFNTDKDLTRLDDKRLIGTVMSLSRSIYGAGAVTAVQVTSETPQHRSGLTGGTVAAPE